MNVVFKVYWNNPIEMVAEAGTQQLTFEVPLGAIISNPSSGGGTASYPSFIGNAAKVLTVNATEDDVEWTAAVTQVYVDTQDSLLQNQINLKADAMATSQSLALKADLVGGVIPAQDYDYLYKAGVAAIFGPGSPVAKAACTIMDILLEE